jgi:hypothetical protein
VSFLKAGLVHVSVGVLGSVVVGVGVLVLDVLVLVFGVRVRVSDTAVLVLVRMRPFMGVLFSHLRSSPLCETPCVVWLLRFGRLAGQLPVSRRLLGTAVGTAARRLSVDYPQPVIDAVMPRNPRTGVLGVEDGVDDELSNVVVLQAVEDRRPLPTGSHQASHPQLGEVLRHRRCGFAHMLSEFVHRHLSVGERPQHLHAGGVGQHPEHLDNQADLIVRQPNILTICMHTQIIAQMRPAVSRAAASGVITR